MKINSIGSEVSKTLSRTLRAESRFIGNLEREYDRFEISRRENKRCFGGVQGNREPRAVIYDERKRIQIGRETFEDRGKVERESEFDVDTYARTYFYKISEIARITGTPGIWTRTHRLQSALYTYPDSPLPTYLLANEPTCRTSCIRRGCPRRGPHPHRFGNYTPRLCLHLPL